MFRMTEKENYRLLGNLYYSVNSFSYLYRSLCILLTDAKDSLLYLVLVINLFSVIANVTWLFQGMEEFGRIVLRNIIFKLLGLAYIFIFVTEKMM